MSINLNYFDAHNHFQDSRLAPLRTKIVADVLASGVKSMLVNGSCEDDWHSVLELAQTYKWIIPAFGYHPWYLESATPEWRTKLEFFLDAVPATIGEIGLDRRKRGLDFEKQCEFFRLQLETATERNLCASIHCIDAWGALLEILSKTKSSERGFLLHSYGGSIELIPILIKLGAFFSFPGYYLNDTKNSKLATFKHIPIERVLLETDAPDQLLPIALDGYDIKDQVQQRRLNHPANISSVYSGFAAAMDISLDDLSTQIEKNYRSLFGDWMRS